MNKIKGYRNMVNMTQEEMANAIDMPLRTYQNKESGNSVFSFSEVVKIKEVLTSKGLAISCEDLR